MKKIKHICIFLMCITSYNIYSQRDSLRQVYRDIKVPDSSRFKALNQLYITNIYNDPKGILEDLFYHRGLAKEKNNKEEQYYSIYREATVLYYLNQYDKSLRQFNEALVLVNELKREDLKAQLLGNRANLYRSKLMYPEAISDLNEALGIYRELKMDRQASWIQQTLGFIYIDIGSYELALKNFKGIQNDTNSSNYGVKMLFANNKLAIGKVYLKKEAYKDAQIYLESALKIFKEQNASFKIAQCYRYLSQIHNMLNETDKAINYATIAIELSKQNNDETSLIYGLLYLAEANFKNDIPTSIKLSHDILSRSINNENYEFNSRLYNLLYKSYRSQNNSDLAFQMLELSSAYQDSLDIKLKNLAVFRELVKQDYEDQLLQSRKFSQRRILSGSVLAIFFIFCFVFYYRKKIKRNIIAKNALIDEIERIKSTTSINQLNVVSARFELDIEKIEQHIGKKLNDTDRKVLFVLLKDPVISNKEIAKKVCLSIEGVGSSLRRMYVYFNIKESKYKKISLLLDAVRLSNN
jgi:tetratricopeptide (TPR) repeat protein